MQGYKGGYPILILFRHAQTYYNAQKRYQGQINCPLNANGFEQANQSGNHISQILSSLLENNEGKVKISECLTSDLQRSKRDWNLIRF